jgi:carbon storage regulator
MLVLTRKSNQSIMIGDDIEVSVLSIMGEKVRIGIQAPRDIPVFRKEVYLEIQEERGEVVATAAVHSGASSTDAEAGSGGSDAGRSLRAEVDRELRELGGR